MKKLVVLLLASLIASTAFAVVDDDPNGIGIYFDLTADDNCTMAPAGAPFSAYVILTNTTAPTVSGYEFGYENMVTGGSFFRLSSQVANGAVGGVDIGNSDDVLVGEHIVGLAAPLVATPALVLHAWSFLLNADGDDPVTMEMYISSVEASSIPGPYPVIVNADSSTLFQAYHSTGAPGMYPVATVNITDCVVGTEDVSFGSVKSLFR